MWVDNQDSMVEEQVVTVILMVLEAKVEMQLIFALYSEVEQVDWL